MFERFIAEQNSHWDGKSVDCGYPRDITTRLKEFLSARHVLALTGVRRCGKSTVLKQLINFLIFHKKVSPKNILFLNVESPALNPYKKDVRNLGIIFDEYIQLATPHKGTVYVFLDEIQFFDDWPVFIKEKYEKGGIKFIITGSNSHLLSQEMATLLSGRAIAKKIYPFSFKEILQIHRIHTNKPYQAVAAQNKIIRIYNEYLKHGGFPEIVLTKQDNLRKEILTAYYKNIVYQDIIPRFEIKKIRETEDLLVYLFSNIARTYSYKSLSGYLKVTDKTIKEYIHYFSSAFLLYEISNYRHSIRKQENFNKKPYTVDNGFISAVALASSENTGYCMENTVFTKLCNDDKNIFYYNEIGECDFVVKEKNAITQAIQVTLTLDRNNEKREIQGLVEAMKAFGLKRGLILTHNQEEIRKVNRFTIHIVPLWKWLISV